MDNICNLYNPDPLQSGSPESSSSGSDGAAQPPHLSDEETTIMLASRHPKKRAGRKKFRETRHPVYRGVRRRNSDKWVSEVREPNKKSRIWLGTFPTAEMAARAHDVAAIALRGRAACLNFADSSWRSPIPTSADAKDIQKAAAEAAHAFRPLPHNDVVEEDRDAHNHLPQNNSNNNNNNNNSNNGFYLDEDAIFGMPGLLAHMAEGMMLPPPPPHSVGSDDYPGDQSHFDVDMSLWSYSF